jgi:class 3 adenylate cyclase
MWNGIDFRGILPAIHVPTLCLFVDNDPTLGPSSGDGVGEFEYFASSIPGALVVKLPPGDFPPWAGHTERASAVLRDFVAEAAAAEADMDRVLSTVLFTDIVESTATAARMGDARWRELLSEHDRLAKGIIARFRGKYVSGTGDGVVATFDGPVRAVRCAHTLSDAIRGIGVVIRAGVHTGEIARSGSTIAGLGVHVAARVAAQAAGGEVWTSSTVKDLTAGSDLSFEEVGEYELKGVPDRWRLFRADAPSLGRTTP